MVFKIYLWNTNRRWGLWITHSSLRTVTSSLSYTDINWLKRPGEYLKGATRSQQRASMEAEEGKLAKLRRTQESMIRCTVPSLFSHTKPNIPYL